MIGMLWFCGTKKGWLPPVEERVAQACRYYLEKYKGVPRLVLGNSADVGKEPQAIEVVLDGKPVTVRVEGRRSMQALHLLVVHPGKDGVQ